MKTLPANMASNKNYGNLEFVILDYNSGDGLEEWVKKNFKSELACGKLVFKRTDKPRYFEWSRSKNMAFRAATGDIVCNVDADNFTGPDFAAYLNRHFQASPNSYLTVNYNGGLNIRQGAFGRIACHKKDFEAVGGFDERMQGYGYEDTDFCLRLGRLGREEHFITDKKYHNTIRHGYKESVSYLSREFEVSNVFLNYISPFRSAILYLFKEGRCSFGTLLDANEGMGNPSIEEGGWLVGTYKSDKNGNLKVEVPERSMDFSVSGENLADEKGEVYYKIRDKTYLKKLGSLYSVIANHQILVSNMTEGRSQVN